MLEINIHYIASTSSKSTWSYNRLQKWNWDIVFNILLGLAIQPEILIWPCLCKL